MEADNFPGRVAFFVIGSLQKACYSGSILGKAASFWLPAKISAPQGGRKIDLCLENASQEAPEIRVRSFTTEYSYRRLHAAFFIAWGVRRS